jgi:hypothetical protein
MNEENDLKYSYSSKPRAVQTNRSAKTKDVTMSPSNKALPPNIMHDPRVVRGSVFAQSVCSFNPTTDTTYRCILTLPFSISQKI